MDRPLIDSVCVYCGARAGQDQAFAAAAADLGRVLADSGRSLVYGGGNVGLMGITADAALARGGRVIGVIPKHLLEVELGHQALTDLHVTANMHERKAKMAELADAFVVLPGGIGTLDETLEILTWRQLGLHDKPVVLLNVDDYWRPFLNLLDRIVEKGFASDSLYDLYHVLPGPAGLPAYLDGLPDPGDRLERELL